MQRWRGQDDFLLRIHFPAHTHHGPRSPPHPIIPDRASPRITHLLGPAARQTALLHELMCNRQSPHCISLLPSLSSLLLSPPPRLTPVEHVGSRESVRGRRRGGVFPDLSSFIYPFVRLERMFRDRSLGSRCLVSALIFPMRSAIRPRVVTNHVP
ncbi:hypothetical protein PISMIDRAFT_607581 [Pisolithus microcarpus 441]|uniref:Unplaced genomic scaffold scaffold_9, whole genome shotgun sequence n=1 Tax=Pisolithus microcarpus 441 TaxID=765257 RepID=A0A0C9YTA9_9AGAM|nr:hypothetical protein PISMIDRAFT_607581 [Pisolithus microcarpus 441]